MHTFVTGSTGSGKSNTIYELIRQTNNLGANFMVIEPAKGEYKHVFGNRSDVYVYGTNPEYSALLRINPFRFPPKIHVLEHVDRLVEIFNVCWPMYAAMPAVLKDALLKSNKEFILQKEFVTLFRIRIPIEFICYEIGPFNASPSE